MSSSRVLSGPSALATTFKLLIAKTRLRRSSHFTFSINTPIDSPVLFSITFLLISSQLAARIPINLSQHQPTPVCRSSNSSDLNFILFPSNLAGRRSDSQAFNQPRSFLPQPASNLSLVASKLKYITHLHRIVVSLLPAAFLRSPQLVGCSPPAVESTSPSAESKHVSCLDITPTVFLFLSSILAASLWCSLDDYFVLTRPLDSISTDLFATRPPPRYTSLNCCASSYSSISLLGLLNKV